MYLISLDEKPTFLMHNCSYKFIDIKPTKIIVDKEVLNDMSDDGY